MLRVHDGPALRGALAGTHVTTVVAHGNDDDLLRDTVRAHAQASPGIEARRAGLGEGGARDGIGEERVAQGGAVGQRIAGMAE